MARLARPCIQMPRKAKKRVVGGGQRIWQLRTFHRRARTYTRYLNGLRTEAEVLRLPPGMIMKICCGTYLLPGTHHKSPHINIQGGVFIKINYISSSLLRFIKTCLNRCAIPQGVFSSLSLKANRILDTVS
jgi:hypothetical protein